MAQLDQIQITQSKLEESFTKRMNELEAQLQTGAPAKDTVARVAEEFRTFRELMFNMLGLLRQQIAECSRVVDAMETRHRRKSLLLMGVAEGDKEDCTTAALDIIRNTLALTNITSSNIRTCHRIGTRNKEHHRPILLKFADVDHRSDVWRAKSKLKGSSVSVKEFLTRPRQLVFAKARQHFGMRTCWTQDGIIVIKVVAGVVKITSMLELNDVILKNPKSSNSLSAAGGGAGHGGTSNVNTKPSKN